MSLVSPVCLVQPTLFPEASRIDIFEYSHALAKLGIETHVIVSEDCSKARFEGLTVHALDFPPRNTPRSWLRFASQARAILDELVRTRGLRIAHLFNPSPATYLLARMLKGQENAPQVIYDLRTGGLGHGPDALLINAMARSAASFTDAMVALTPALGKALLGEKAGFVHVPLGVNLEAFTPAVRPHARREFVFVYAGTLSRNRHLKPMLAAFAQTHRHHPEARLRIAGDGTDRAALQALCAKLGLRDAVAFLGKLPYAEIPALLAEADCGLAYVPQKPWFEPQPQLKTLEYFAMNLPVVAVRTQGNAQYWQGLPAELLTEDDAGAFAAGMSFALGQRQRPESRPYRDVAERFSWDRITREHLVPLYERLLP
jgi:glycosyltransferase involved in cell wall biosynthesis